MKSVDNIADLEALYGFPDETSMVKEIDHLIAEYQAYIEASAFVALVQPGQRGWTVPSAGTSKALFAFMTSGR